MQQIHLSMLLQWAVYFSLHSLLARQQAKTWVADALPALAAYYRLFYNLLASVGLLAILLYGATLPATEVVPPSQWMRYLGMVLAAWGIIVVRQAFKHYSMRSFMGVDRQESETEPLQTEGILRYVRHPLYSGTILISIGFWLYLPGWTNLMTVLSWWVYLPIGIYLEEQKLINYYGEVYLDYKKRVPALVPSLWWWRKRD